jgi:hypothetical protein
MRTLCGLLLSLFVGVQGARAAPPPASNHPILGIWTLALPEIGCHEVYRFRGDGTTLVTSAEEVSESEFQIPASPSDKGFYKLEDKVTRDNGKRDCAGAVMKVGTRNTNYIRFHPSGVLFLMCANESMDSCIGPFERVLGKST